VLLSLLVAVCLVLMWAIPAALHGGSVYANEIFWGQTAGRMSKSFAHKRDWWWYLPVLPVILFPWLFWPATWKGVIRLARQGRDWRTRMLLAWLLPVFLAFWLISGKQVHYLLPLFPAFALLLSRGLQEPARVSAAGIAVPALVMLALAITLIVLPGMAGSHRIPAMVGYIPGWAGYLLLALAVLVPLLGRSGDVVRQAHVLQAAGVAFMFIIMSLVIHPLTRNQDINAFSRHVARLQRQNIAFAHVGTYHDQFQFAGRLRKPVQVISRNQLRNWVATHPKGRVLIYRSGTQGPLYRVAEARMIFRKEWLLLVRSSDLARIWRGK
jgi:4-amino-4-deoxy-L-arabinose transferase-like glycosyltransferase